MMWVPARLMPLAALSMLAFTGCAAQRQAEPTSTPTYGGAPAGAAARAEPQAQQPGYPGSAPGYAQPAATPGEVGSTAQAGKDEDAELDRLEDAEAALAEARTKLESLTGIARDATKTDDVEKKSSGSPAKSPARKPKGASEATELAQGNARCAEACKAFASLRRAAEAVCRLTSETDARCAKARALVDENRKRVQVCRCEENEK